MWNIIWVQKSSFNIKRQQIKCCFSFFHFPSGWWDLIQGPSIEPKKNSFSSITKYHPAIFHNLLLSHSQSLTRPLISLIRMQQKHTSHIFSNFLCQHHLKKKHTICLKNRGLIVHTTHYAPPDLLKFQGEEQG